MSDAPIRQRAFALLEELSLTHGDVLPYAALSAGFMHDGKRVPLLGPQGIFKPAVCELPLSIATAPPKAGKPRPYDDEVGPDGLLRYRYRGTDPAHIDNVGLREAMRLQVPLIYLHGVAKGEYVAAWPVFVVGDDPKTLTFTVAVDDLGALTGGVRASGTEAEGTTAPEVAIRRRYVTATVLRRLHQSAFRERVLAAYRTRCAVCALKHKELLDAAHIVPDRHERGEPSVQNGLSLCKLHHGAFDANLFGVRPDRIIEVRASVLEEHDGLMLKYGLQEIHTKPLIVPKDRAEQPRPDLLEERYALFKKTG